LCSERLPPTGAALKNLRNQGIQIVLSPDPSRPPKHLGEAGANLWRGLVSEYGIADAGGLKLVETACTCADRLAAAQDALARDGVFITDRYGQPKLHPAAGLEKDARAGLLAALKGLNLDLEPLRDGPGRPAGG